MLDDLSDVYRELRALRRELNHLRSGIPLENTAVRNGRLRFIGGLLLIDSGGRLQIVGQLDGEGNFEWSGPWRFDSGDGEIAGNVDLTGILSLLGTLSVATGGSIEVGDVVIESGVGGSGGMTAPVKITLQTPLVDVLGALGVSQALVAQGAVTFSGLSSAPPGATTVPLVLDVSTNRVHRG